MGADGLPIAAVLAPLRDALQQDGAAVLVAPPGAGKTTRVPLALLGEPWLGDACIVMLEPRRIAARAAAAYMARLLGERVGDTVGYRIRLERRIGAGTRIEVVTEGVLTRWIQSDPALGGVGIVIFDEFHERSLHADLGLALTLHARALLRPELRVLVMSATLDAAPVALRIGERTRTITSEGRSHPVETRYVDRPIPGWVEPAVAATVRSALQRQPGDVLVFLPGAAEIRRVADALRDEPLPPDVDVAPLHGSLPRAAQDAAIAASPPGRRKVVLATAVAQTSLTIEGVRTVVDSGLARVPRFSARTGMTRLETLRVSRAAADQRRGRAGRLGPGVCYRLWTEFEQRGLVPYTSPEILEADLAPLALELAVWGAAPDDLAWLDPPPAAAFRQARELLAELGAVDTGGAATAHGRHMASLGLHPRLAHMLLAAPAHAVGLACDVAALLEERDLLRGLNGPPDPDLRLRLDAVEAARRGGRARGGIDRATLDRVIRHADRLRRRLDAAGPRATLRTTDESPGELLALAYPDRLAQARGERGRFRLRSGRGAAVPAASALASHAWVVAAALDDRGVEGRIALGAPIEADAIDRRFADRVVVERTVEWDDTARTVRAREHARLGALVLRETPLAEPAPGEAAAALTEGVRRAGLEALPWDEHARRLRERLAFLHRLDPGWPDVSDAGLLDGLEPMLASQLARRRSGAAAAAAIDVAALLLDRLDGRQRASLDAIAPTHIEVPSGSRIRVDYADAATPVLAVRLQELFGLEATPRIANGRVPLTLHLLSPAGRPVQVTRDLASFWRDAYHEVRKDLRGRYPKHDWPENPLAALPSRGARGRR